MSKILKVDYVQKSISRLKDEKSYSIRYNPERGNEIVYGNGKSICAGCMNCVNPKCMRLKDEDVECAEFPEISHDMNRLVCPVNAIKSGSKSIEIDEHKCIGCGLCVASCPIGAIYLKNGKAKVSARDDSSHLILSVDSKGIKQQQDFIDSIIIDKREGIIQKESDQVLESIYKQIKKMSQEEQNIMVRNLLIRLGNHATLSRQGNVYMRMDGFYSNDKQSGVVEIETGADMLDVSRAILDDVAVVNVRYDIKKANDHPVAVVLSLPNKRTDYWQVLKDIKNVIKMPIGTITFGALLMLLWNDKEINDFDEFYIDVDNSSIRTVVEKILKRKTHVSDGFLGVLENSK